MLRYIFVKFFLLPNARKFYIPYLSKVAYLNLYEYSNTFKQWSAPSPKWRFLPDRLVKYSIYPTIVFPTKIPTKLKMYLID